MILIATIILPSQVTLIPTYAFFRSIGWGGTWLPLIVPHFFANAYNVFLLRQYFMGIPKDLDEAAMIDGASPTLPGFLLIPDPHPDDKAYRRDRGENWYPEAAEGIDIAGSLHEEFYNPKGE